MATGLFVKARDLSEQTGALVEKVISSGDTCYITKDGRAKAVLMDIQRYNALMDLVEDAELPSEELLNEKAEHVSVRRILSQNAPKASP